MRDIDGVKLKIGDRVSYVERGYRNLLVGKVTGFTPQKIRIKRINEEKLHFPNQVTKIVRINPEYHKELKCAIALLSQHVIELTKGTVMEERQDAFKALALIGDTQEDIRNVVSGESITFHTIANKEDFE